MNPPNTPQYVLGPDGKTLGFYDNAGNFFPSNAMSQQGNPMMVGMGMPTQTIPLPNVQAHANPALNMGGLSDMYNNYMRAMQAQTGDGGVETMLNTPPDGQADVQKIKQNLMGATEDPNITAGQDPTGMSTQMQGQLIGLAAGGVGALAKNMFPNQYDQRIGMEKPNFMGTMLGDTTFTQAGASFGPVGAGIGAGVDLLKNAAAFSKHKAQYNAAGNKADFFDERDNRQEGMAYDFTGLARNGMEVKNPLKMLSKKNGLQQYKDGGQVTGNPFGVIGDLGVGLVKGIQGGYNYLKDKAKETSEALVSSPIVQEAVKKRELSKTPNEIVTDDLLRVYDSEQYKKKLENEVEQSKKLFGEDINYEDLYNNRVKRVEETPVNIPLGSRFGTVQGYMQTTIPSGGGVPTTNIAINPELAKYSGGVFSSTEFPISKEEISYWDLINRKKASPFTFPKKDMLVDSEKGYYSTLVEEKEHASHIKDTFVDSDKNVENITPYALKIIKENQAEDKDKDKTTKVNFGYLSDPTEVIAKKRSAELFLNAKGYKKVNENVQDKHFDDLLNDESINRHQNIEHLIRFLSGKTGEDVKKDPTLYKKTKERFLNIMNKIAQNDDNQNVPFGRNGMEVKNDMVPVEIERQEKVFTRGEDGSYKLYGQTSATAPMHEQGGVKTELPQGALVFPKEYHDEIEHAMRHGGQTGDWSMMDKVTNKMKEKSAQAFMDGKPYSTGGAPTVLGKGRTITQTRYGTMLKYTNGGEVQPLTPTADDMRTTGGSAGANPRADIEKLKGLKNITQEESLAISNEFKKKYGEESKMAMLASTVLLEKIQTSQNFKNSEFTVSPNPNFVVKNYEKGAVENMGRPTQVLEKQQEYTQAVQYINGTTNDLTDDYVVTLLDTSTGAYKDQKGKGQPTATGTAQPKQTSAGTMPNMGRALSEQQKLNMMIQQDKTPGRPELLKEDDVIGPKTLAAMNYYQQKNMYKRPELFSDANLAQYKKNIQGGAGATTTQQPVQTTQPTQAPVTGQPTMTLPPMPGGGLLDRVYQEHLAWKNSPGLLDKVSAEHDEQVKKALYTAKKNEEIQLQDALNSFYERGQANLSSDELALANDLREYQGTGKKTPRIDRFLKLKELTATAKPEEKAEGSVLGKSPAKGGLLDKVYQDYKEMAPKIEEMRQAQKEYHQVMMFNTDANDEYKKARMLKEKLYEQTGNLEFEGGVEDYKYDYVPTAEEKLFKTLRLNEAVYGDSPQLILSREKTLRSTFLGDEKQGAIHDDKYKVLDKLYGAEGSVLKKSPMMAKSKAAQFTGSKAEEVRKLKSALQFYRQEIKKKVASGDTNNEMHESTVRAEKYAVKRLKEMGVSEQTINSLK